MSILRKELHIINTEGKKKTHEKLILYILVTINFNETVSMRVKLRKKILFNETFSTSVELRQNNMFNETLSTSVKLRKKNLNKCSLT
jgi:hypothetical protein